MQDRIIEAPVARAADAVKIVTPSRQVEAPIAELRIAPQLLDRAKRIGKCRAVVTSQQHANMPLFDMRVEVADPGRGDDRHTGGQVLGELRR